ncbi:MULTISPECIES: hypothetical protein [unclassified Flavobacterium]|uniref:hypothetical protein n=1 Tax=unclassified Flavobacterium TaxID=196869 RepID=UPI00131D02CE|nr:MULTISPECIES: hypothetical protein [unclassified Flavobacterium]
MLHYPYFKQCNKRYYQAVNEIHKDLSEINVKTFSLIGKLNESQFFLFLSNYIYYFRFEDIDITTLKHFFYIHYDHSIENNQPLPFQDNQKFKNEEKSNIITEASIAFNCKKELSKLIAFHLEMREYPKETHSHLLLVLSDKIYEHISYPLSIFKIALINHIDNLDIEVDNFDIKKISFLLDINGELEKYENHLEKLQSQIHKKVMVLTTSKNVNNHGNKNGNYQINMSNGDLRNLYKNLEKIMLIDQNKTSLNQFIEVFENDWESHNSIIYLEMDNILFKHFIDFIKTYFDIKIELSTIEYSAKIANKNGIIKANAIYSSMAQYRRFTKERDDIKILKSMFEKIKNH